MKKSSRVLHCRCVHPWQDKRYGNGMRVHNRMKAVRGSGKEEEEGSYRCVICNATKWSK